MGNSEFLILLYSVAIIFAITFGYVNPYSPYYSSALFAPLICYIGGIAIRSASSTTSQQQTPNSSDSESININVNNNSFNNSYNNNNNNNNSYNSNNNNNNNNNNSSNINSNISNNNNNNNNNGNNSNNNNNNNNINFNNRIKNTFKSAPIQIPNNNNNNSFYEDDINFRKYKSTTASDISELNHHSSLSSGISSSLGGGQNVSDLEIMNEFLGADPLHSLNKEQQEKERIYKQQQQLIEQQQQLQQLQQLHQQHQQAHNSNFEPKRTLKNVSRVYREVNENQPKEYYDYENYRINWQSVERYEIVQKIGRGKYSEVFSGVDMETDQEVVIKVLKPVQKLKIQREIKILESLNGGTNIIPLLDYVKDPCSKVCSLVFPFVNKTDIRELVNYLEDYDIRYYMYELLKAIDYTHSRGVIHRDIKPLNIAIDHSRKKLFLLDWGLAEFYHPYKNYNVRVASRHYKPPELLVNMYDYDYSLDMWSFGCLFAGLILDRDPFFAGENNNNQLLKIVKVLGTDDLFKFLDKFGLSLNEEQAQMIKPRAKSNWERFIPYENEDIATPDAIDFLDKLLRFDPTERLTAREAMEHKYFDVLKSKNHSINISNK